MQKLLRKLFKSQNDNIYDLISKDDSDGIKRLLETGQDPNEPDEFGQTPIFRVVYNKTKNQEVLLKLLIKFGAMLNARKSDGATPIFHARGNVARLLLEAGADINIKSFNNATPLHYSHDKETTNILINHGLDINAKDDTFKTPLHNYVYFGSDLVEYAIQNGAEVNAIDMNGWTPLICLSQNQYVQEKDWSEILKKAEALIHSGAQLDVTDKLGKTAYDHSLEAGNRALANWLKQEHKN
ncbi:MAG: ankyrin repeat domain-containing protein [Sporocytophaga sp.]|nr:ankyrin repeat domain-containing protein [Sporocytophaga sp.]